MTAQTPMRRVDRWRVGVRAMDRGRLYAFPVHPVLLVVWVVLSLYLENAAEVRPREVLSPLLLFVGIASAVFVILRLLLKGWQRAALVTTALLLPLVSFGHVRRVVPEALVGDDRILALVCVVAALFIIILFDRRQSFLPAMNRGLDLVSFVLVAMAVGSILMFHTSELLQARSTATLGDDPGRAADTSRHPDADRDIFHIVLDTYGSDEALLRGLGIDNTPFTDWLVGRGFDVVEGARANYARSILSLSATLDMRLLGELSARVGSGTRSLEPLEDLIRHNPAAARLKESGYEYYHLGSWWPVTKSSSVADHSYSADVSRDFMTALWSTTALPAFTELFTFPQRHAEAAEFQFDMLNRLAAEPSERPRYVFAHILMPHAPYVLLADGTYSLGEASYESQLRYVNAQLRVLVDRLLRRPAPKRPIIVLQADEGPPLLRTSDDGPFDWEMATAEELKVRFGVLNAMYLPGPEIDAPLPKGLTLVNTYPELFRRYFGVELARQPDRQYTSTDGRPFEFTDVTDRIDGRQIKGSP